MERKLLFDSPQVWDKPITPLTPKRRNRRHKYGSHFAPWMVNVHYQVGRICISGGANYVCITDHISGAGDDPAAMPLTWTAI